MPKPRLAVVEWVDANCLHIECDDNSLPALAKIRTVGWVLEMNKRVIVITTERLRTGGVETYRCTTAIPRSWEVRVTWLEEE